MDAFLRRSFVGSIGIMILSDVTKYLEKTNLPKEEWPSIIIDAIIFVLERGEIKLKIPLVEMVKIAAEKSLSERSN